MASVADKPSYQARNAASDAASGKSSELRWGVRMDWRVFMSTSLDDKCVYCDKKAYLNRTAVFSERADIIENGRRAKPLQAPPPGAALPVQVAAYTPSISIDCPSQGSSHRLSAGQL